MRFRYRMRELRSTNAKSDNKCKVKQELKRCRDTMSFMNITPAHSAFVMVRSMRSVSCRMFRHKPETA